MNIHSLIEENNFDMLYHKIDRETSFVSLLFVNQNRNLPREVRWLNHLFTLEFELFVSSYYLNFIRNQYNPYLKKSLESWLDQHMAKLEMLQVDEIDGLVDLPSGFNYSKDYLLEKIGFYITDITKITDSKLYNPVFSFLSLQKKPLERIEFYEMAIINKASVDKIFIENYLSALRLFGILISDYDFFLKMKAQIIDISKQNNRL